MIRCSRDPFGASCPLTVLVKGHHRTVASRALLYLEWISVAIAILPLASLRANSPPNTPVISEPATEGQIVNPGDVHMETRPFSDPDPGDTHLCSDWEIWTVTPSGRVWLTACIGGVERIHTHLGDGVFQGSHAGRTELFPDTDYRLRVRHSDSSGDPATEWSAWAERGFRTGPQSQVFPLLLDDVLDSPPPDWMDSGLSPVVLAGVASPPFLRIESGQSDLILELRGKDGISNAVTNPAPLSGHVAARVRASAGGSGQALLLPESQLRFTDDEGVDRTIYLPSLNVAPGIDQYFCVSKNGSTYAGTSSQTSPDFSTLAQGAPVPWEARQTGYKVEVVASGFKLPVNIAFVASPGPGAKAPLYYVTELYGTIKVVTRDAR